MPPPRLILEWVDLAGNFLRSSSWVFNNSNLAALEAALQAASNANLLYATSGIPTIGVVVPSDALYPLAADLAAFNFQTAAGTGLQVVVPAPLAAMFGPYGTVNAGQPVASALIAAIIACLGDSSGNPATAFAGGLKVSRRVEQFGR